MSGELQTQAAAGEAESWRGRGGSGARVGPSALWTLLSWLRRDDRSCSSDSLSSAGSDRTAVSFAFLAAPATLATPPQRACSSPLSPRAPLTDSYRKRVHESDARRKRERDLTLHRKYGLYYGYDAFSLPPARKYHEEATEELDRDRRANSESLPRRTAHVPGKRRAPLPPSRPHSLISTASLTRRHNRKRPAPQPPVEFIEKSKENNNMPTTGCEDLNLILKMNSNSGRDRRPLSNVESSNESKSEKHSKTERSAKESKPRREKSFLKQIFDNKKRSSTIEPERILPSISELDKQAAEIIKSCKLKPVERNNNTSDGLGSQDAWFCTRCLRRYDSTTVTCEHCLPEQKRLSTLDNTPNKVDTSAVLMGSTITQLEKEDASTNRVSGICVDEKKKLREMLKEMKDSLPKNSKQDFENKSQSKNFFKFDSTDRNSLSLETPTLRVESKVSIPVSDAQPSTSKQVTSSSNNTEITNIKKIFPKLKQEPVTESVVITQHVVLVAPESKNIDSTMKYNVTSGVTSTASSFVIDEDKTKENKLLGTASNENLLPEKNVHTPLKISSLLNPVYIPKSNISEEQTPRSIFLSQTHGLTKTLNNCTTPNTPIKVASLSQSNKIPTSCTEFKNVSTSKTITTKSHLSASPKLISVNKNHESKPVPQLSTNKEGGVKELVNSNQTLLVSKLNQTAAASSITSTSLLNPSDKTKLQSNMVKFTVDQHSRRRELVNQLEQSIANGDERAAAEAAVKLAQLRLSCSVLSFSSQIMAEPTKLPRLAEENINPSNSNSAEQTRVKAIRPTISETSKVNSLVEPSTSGVSDIKIKSGLDLKKQIKTEKLSSQGDNQATAASMKNKQLLQGTTVEYKNKEVHNEILHIPSTAKNLSKSEDLTTIQIWVEDREATRGPVHLRISRQAVMGDLRRQAEISMGLAGALQRWIVGRALCTEDNTPLVSLAGPDLSAPFYLCVVESEGAGAQNNGKTSTISETNHGKTSDVYYELVELEQRALVVNTEQFECGICMEECAANGGAVLRECVHTFCRGCLSDLVKHCEEPIVTCPAMGCPGVLQEREIRALVSPVEYEKWLARGLAAAENGTRNAFHCRTRDCTGWALCDPGVRRFPCPVCKHTNCITCQAIHEGETCEQYRKKLQKAESSSTTTTDEGTRELLDTLMSKGEALECPECSAIITKKWGCDWVKCSACKTEICWVTRGRRWGPGGKGDTSGGCRCGVDGKRCHPSCGYCH